MYNTGINNKREELLMSEKKEILKIGIIGCGNIAFAKHLPALSKLKSVEIVAFCDIVTEKAEKAAKQFGTETAKVYYDYRELIKDKSIDVVHICTPNKSHADITIASLEAGKHVMCEKPIAKTSADARRMIESAKRTGKKLTIGYQNRYRPDSQYLHKLCQANELGEIYFAKAHAIRRYAIPTWGNWESITEEDQGGGPLLDIGPHALDLTLWMMNNYKPKSVMGSAFYKLGKIKNSANAWGPWDPEKYKVEDSAFGFIKMENGATIILESSWALNILDTGEAKTTLCGTEGGADMRNGLTINGQKFGKTFVTKPGLDAAGVDFYDGNEESASDMESRLWIESILNGTEPVVLPEEALVVTEILEAIYESSKSGKPVYFE